MDNTEKNQELIKAAETAYSSGDLKSAFENYREAAIKGSGEAAYHLGQMYEKGVYVKRDFKAAMQWYYTSAKNGCQQAREKLGHNIAQKNTAVRTETTQQPEAEESAENEEYEDSPTGNNTKQKRRFWIPFAAAVLVLVVIAVFLLNNGTNKKYAEKQLPEYYRLINECNNFAKQDTDEGLLNAKTKLREIKGLESKYSDILPSEYDKSRTFSILENTLKHRSSEWAEKAIAQIGDIGKAKTCLYMAKKFYDNENINRALELSETNPTDKAEIKNTINQAIKELK